MTRCFALAVAAGVLCAGGCNKKAPLKDFASADGKFKVRIPGTPKEDSKEASGVTLQLFTVTERNNAYMVAYADMPIGENEPDAQVQARLDGAVDGAVRNANATLTTSSAVTLDGKHPGRDLRADLPSGQGVIHARVYLVGRRMYQVMTVGSKSWVDSAEATQFIDSLTVTP